MKSLAHRVKRTLWLAFLIAFGLSIFYLIESAPKFFVNVGEFFECKDGMIYNGEECVKSNTSMGFWPPCPSGYKEVDKICVWNGRD